MRRAVPVLLASFLVLAPLGVCGDDDGSTTPPEETTGDPGEDSTSTAGGSTSSSGSLPELTPPTTEDLDGVEPDFVEPPPVGGVPAASTPTPSGRRVALPGFGEVVVQVRTVDGEVVEWCLLLAETSAQTQRGLMEVTDPELGGYDGMLFRFEAEHDGGFYMRNTPQPLEIAYLGTDGRVVGIREMDPCEDVDGCPTYSPGGPYVRTIEVPLAAGGVRALGIGDDADVEVVDTGRTCAGLNPCHTPCLRCSHGSDQRIAPARGATGSLTRSNRHPAPDRPGPRQRRVHREVALADASVRTHGHRRRRSRGQQRRDRRPVGAGADHGQGR